jgi:hypothetical protein
LKYNYEQNYDFKYSALGRSGLKSGRRRVDNLQKDPFALKAACRASRRAGAGIFVESFVSKNSFEIERIALFQFSAGACGLV